MQIFILLTSKFKIMKTIDDAAKDYALYNYDVSDISLSDGFEAGVEFAQKWISVDDELPLIKNSGFSDLVLTKNKHNNIKLERYDYENKRFNEIRYDFQVTHWRPIELE